MAQVGIVMGSDSDMPIMAKAADILDQLGVSYEMTIISAHREPDVFFEYAKSAEEKGFKVIIAGAGMAAHLPGMCAAIFPMPVIGIPMHTTSLGGRDSTVETMRCTATGSIIIWSVGKILIISDFPITRSGMAPPKTSPACSRTWPPLIRKM